MGRGNRQKEKWKIHCELYIQIHFIFFIFLATLWSRSKARLSLQPWASYLKMAFCLGGFAFALEKGWHLWPKLKTYCWQQQLLLSLLLWLLLSLLIKSSLGVTALLIRRLLLWGLGREAWLEVAWGAARLLLHLINDALSVLFYYYFYFLVVVDFMRKTCG